MRSFRMIGLMAMLLVLYQQCGPSDSGELYGPGYYAALPSSTPDEPAPRPLAADPTAVEVDNAHEMALTLLQRLSQRTPPDAPVVREMAALLAQNRVREAALAATKTDGFYNYVVRDMATKMSNREQSTAGTLNDFVATFVGVARDDIDARELLTGDYFYWAPRATTARRNLSTDVVNSNNHYLDLELQQANLASLLEKQSGVMISNGGALATLADPAGVLTSRAFLSTHAVAGTNRRLVEYSMSQFLCAPIETWANIATPDFYVGRDITREPTSLFRSKCVGCHAPMDALRPAFAHVDFVFTGSLGVSFYRRPVTADAVADVGDAVSGPVPADEQMVPSKFRRNRNIFPEGHKVANDQWENLISDKYGWRTAKTGRGLREFGRMLAESRGFSRCMVRRAFQTICYESSPAEESAVIDELATKFEQGGYLLRSLFADVATHKSCLGGLGQ